MRKTVSLTAILLVSFCKLDSQSGGNSVSVFQNLGILLTRSSRLTVSGTAVKGIIKNGKVTVSRVSKDGSCDANILAASETDQEGIYSLTYFKTGGMVCVTISGQPNSRTKIYDEKSKSEIAVTSSSDFKLVSIISESRLTQAAKKNAVASPFSNMLVKRFQQLIKESPSADAASLYKKASKEVVIRFGLNTGLSSVKSAMTGDARLISDNDYPELDDLAIDLTKPGDPGTTKFIALMAGFSQLANQYKAGTQLSSNDLSSVINAFAVDFEDGAFDGKGIQSSSISIGSGTNQAAFTGTPLTGLLLPAVVTFIKEGGSLSAGTSTSEAPPSVTAAQVSAQIQFVDNTPINSSVPIALPFPLTDSGQTTCYNDTTSITCGASHQGQDADYVNIPNAISFTGPTAHSTFTGDYTTKDNVTGLVWKSCPEGKSGPTCAAGTLSYVTKTNAVNACAALNTVNSGAGYAGKTDWRLPSVLELFTLFNYGIAGAVKMDSAKFPGTLPDLWSSTIFNGSNTWQIVNDGTAYSNLNSSTYGVRCVSGTGVTAQSFTDKGDGSIKDNNTGLIWQKCAMGLNNDSGCTGSMSSGGESVGLSYCEGLTLAGRSDWRLPNVKELQSIIDYSTAPTINAVYFPNTGSTQFITSTAFNDAPTNNNYISFTDGTVNNDSGKTAGWRTRCVTGP